MARKSARALTCTLHQVWTNDCRLRRLVTRSWPFSMPISSPTGRDVMAAPPRDRVNSTNGTKGFGKFLKGYKKFFFNTFLSSLVLSSIIQTESAFISNLS